MPKLELNEEMYESIKALRVLFGFNKNEDVIEYFVQSFRSAMGALPPELPKEEVKE